MTGDDTQARPAVPLLVRAARGSFPIALMTLRRSLAGS